MFQYCGINMSEEEIKSIKKFDQEHLKCAKGNGLIQFIITPNGIGTDKVIRCRECGATEDITTGECW